MKQKLKNYILHLSFLLLLGNVLFAQAPNKMSYQAVIRNSSNLVVSNHAVGMRISILQGSATGTSVYTEIQKTTTNANGLIAIEIGTGTIVSDSFSNIDWSNGPYFVKTETDPNGGTNYTLTGISQLLSVPYALYSMNSENSVNSKKSDTANIALNGVPSGSQHGQTLMNCNGDIVWVLNGQCPAKIASFNCTDTTHSGVITSNFSSINCISSVSYAGGNGGVYASQIIPSSGVTGLTATLAAGTLNTGNGVLILNISGIPNMAGTASFLLQIGNKTCVIQRSVIIASITNFNCADTLHSGSLYANFSANQQSTLSYSGGNSANYPTQTIASTGVLGMTATLASGALNSGNGTLSLNITGTPTSAGIASFTIFMGNKTCTLQRTVLTTPPTPTWPIGTVFCNSTATAIVNVTNPLTGKTWMDRNLGASQAATSSADPAAYGDSYQWGRKADGHQCRNSGTTSSLSSTDQPNNANFILSPNSPFDWHSIQNDKLWQGVNGVNNPCPMGYRIPTIAELEVERNSWTQNNSSGALNSPLKFPLPGGRSNTNGALGAVGSNGSYWSSTVAGSNAWYLLILNSLVDNISNLNRARGLSVRCIRDY